MEEEVTVLTKYNNLYETPGQRYLWVYAEEDFEKKKDIAKDHAPVLDWQSGLENLKELQTEPVTQEKIKEPDDEPQSCGCMIQKIDIVDFDEEAEKELINIKEILENLSLKSPSNLIQRFLETKSSIYLSEAIDATKTEDPVSCYKLNKVAKKLNLVEGIFEEKSKLNKVF